MNGHTSPQHLNRRSVLATMAAVASAGCVESVTPASTSEDASPVSLSIRTLPADADPVAIRIARSLSEHLQQVGVDAQTVPVNRKELHRNVFLDRTFDLYVGQHPGYTDPDFLRQFLHSRYADERGKQNPFGYENATVDRLLERQVRQPTAARRETLGRLQRLLVHDQPFSVVAFPDAIRATRRAGVDDEWGGPLHEVQSYLTLSPSETADGDGDGGPVQASESSDTQREGDSDRTLRVTLTDSRTTENVNPLSVAFRGGDPVTDLLYDSLGTWADGEFVPWLASDWVWQTGEDGNLVADVQLRSDLRWHDDTPLTADDVAFTYRFLRDTSLGDLDPAVPTPRYRGRSALVDETVVLADDRLRIRFGVSNERVAARAFAVPVLPEHVWRERTDPDQFATLSSDWTVTEALVAANLDPVGSGPLRFVAATEEKSVVLEPYEDHFLETSNGLSDPITNFRGGFEFDRLRFRVVPSSAAAVKLLKQGKVDVTGSSLAPGQIAPVARAQGARLHVQRTSSFYYVGFNHRVTPLDDPGFRRIVARLVDRAYVVESELDGYAAPAASPLETHPWLDPNVAWRAAEPPLPFYGSDGSLDAAQARDALERVGYEFTENGTLLAGR